MSAVSNMETPASRQTSSRRRASAVSVAPQAANSLPLPPKVPVPKLNTGTLNPDAPRRRYSMALILCWLRLTTVDRGCASGPARRGGNLLASPNAAADLLCGDLAAHGAQAFDIT